MFNLHTYNVGQRMTHVTTEAPVSRGPLWQLFNIYLLAVSLWIQWSSGQQTLIEAALRRILSLDRFMLILSLDITTLISAWSQLHEYLAPKPRHELTRSPGRWYVMAPGRRRPSKSWSFVSKTTSVSFLVYFKPPISFRFKLLNAHFSF